MFDRKLINCYQWIVDTTEKKPAWLATQAMMLSASFDIVSTVVAWKGTGSAVWLFVMMTVAAILINAARNEATFKTIGEVPYRPIFLALSAVGIGIMIFDFTGVRLLSVISNIMFVSYYYFAACESPRPKKRKEKLVLSNA